MADVSTLKINDNSYNIKDATARSNITTLTSTVDAKLDTSHVVNEHTINTAGYAMDARQANPNVSGSLAAQIDNLSILGEWDFGGVGSSGVSVQGTSSPDVYTNVMSVIPRSGPGYYLYIFKLSTGVSTPYIRRVRLFYAFNTTATQPYIWDGELKRTALGVAIVNITQAQIDSTDPRIFLQINATNDVNFSADNSRNAFYLIKIGPRRIS